jgi:flavin reductase (DIM6/NTAB) family NADH-FMN oxidoreductase RutF
LSKKGILPIEPSLTYRLFYPQVPIIVCAKHGENVAGMTANSVMSVSGSPPKVSLAINAKSRTGRIVIGSHRFSINWLSYDHASSRKAVIELSKPFKENKEHHHDKLKCCKIPYRLVCETPILKQAEAFAICSVSSIRRAGDHFLFVAGVTQASATADFVHEGYWRFKDYEPILYLGSNRRKPLTTLGSRL